MNEFELREKEIEVERHKLEIMKLESQLQDKMLEQLEKQEIQLNIDWHKNKINQLKTEIDVVSLLNG
jgi:hypothetical protein